MPREADDFGDFVKECGAQAAVEAMRAKCEGIIRRKCEAFSLKDGKPFLYERTEGSLNGLAYADAIAALKAQLNG